MAYRRGKFLFFLYKNDLKTMSEVLYRATKYMNAEDALSAREDKPERERDLNMPGRTMGGRNRGRETDARRSVLNPRGKTYKLYPSDRPTRPSTDADQG